MPDTCSACGKSAAADKKLLKCARCLSAQYCNGTCQKNHWKTHKTQCQAPKAAAPQNQFSSLMAKAVEQKKSSDKVVDFIKNISIDDEEDPLDYSETVDATGVNMKDVDEIVKLRKCKKNAAIKALKENKNDIVEAILSLTPGIESAQE